VYKNKKKEDNKRNSKMFSTLIKKKSFSASITKFRYLFQELSMKDIAPTSINIRNRPNLPGSTNTDLPEFISSRESEYLKIIQLKDDNQRNLNDIGLKLNKYITNNIDQHSAILIKGLKIKTLEELMELTKHFEYENMSYKSGSGFRDHLSDNIYLASIEPDNYSIEPHNEMAYVNKSPSKIMFCCLKEAPIGGESPISFNREIANYLNKDVLEKLIQKKIRYYRNLPHEKNTDYISWQRTFETSCEKKAEEIMEQKGISWEWLGDGNLSLYNIVDATRQHPVTKEQVWFNHATTSHHTYYKVHPVYENQPHLQPNEYLLDCCYGDGEPFEEETVNHIRAATWNNAIGLKLEQGDIIFLDNYLCSHSRMSYEGERKFLVQMYE